VRQLQAHPVRRGDRLTAGSKPGRLARAWIDGGARGNPGPAGFGVFAELETEAGVESAEILGFLGNATNNVAEYTGLLAALEWALLERVERLDLRSDSLLLVKQLAGQYRVKAPHLVPLFARASSLKRRIPQVSIRHVRREENQRADALANRAMDERTPPPDWLHA
jgi:ribonuclease HI